MAKFCGKCGSKLDDVTGVCYECSNAGNAEHTYKTNATEVTVFADDTKTVAVTENNTAEPAEKSHSPKFCGKCGCKMDAQTGKCPVCDSSVFEKPADLNKKYGNKINGAKPSEEKSSKGKRVAVIASSVIVVVLFVFFALDLFEVVNTGVFRNLGITPFSSDSSADEADESQSEDKEKDEQSAQDDTTVAETTENSSESESESSQSTTENTQLWKEALIRCINESENDDAVFSLVYINDDDIPEIYAVKKSQDTGGYDMVYCSDKEGNTNGTSVGNKSLLYMERGNLCCSHESDGDTIYTIDNGWNILYSGFSYMEADKTYYTWQNAEVTEKEYNSQFKAVFDISKVKKANEKTYSRKEIIDKINKL